MWWWGKVVLVLLTVCERLRAIMQQCASAELPTVYRACSYRRYIESAEQCATTCKNRMEFFSDINGVTFRTYPTACFCERQMRMMYRGKMKWACFLKGTLCFFKRMFLFQAKFTYHRLFD